VAANPEVSPFAPEEQPRMLHCVQHDSPWKGARLWQFEIAGRMVADSEVSSEPGRPVPAKPAGDFRLEAVRRAFGAEDEKAIMPAAWTI